MIRNHMYTRLYQAPCQLCLTISLLATDSISHEGPRFFTLVQPWRTSISFFFLNVVRFMRYVVLHGLGVQVLPWTKKEKNHPRDSWREERCSTCDIMLDHEWSAQGTTRGQSRIGPCPALIARDQAWCHTWNSVFLAVNLKDGSFFLSRVVQRAPFHQLDFWRDTLN